LNTHPPNPPGSRIRGDPPRGASPHPANGLKGRPAKGGGGLTNKYMVIMSPEVLLSIVVLGLVLYGINFSTFKASIGVLLIIGIMISFGFPMEISTISVEESVAFNAIHWTGGLLMVNSWIIISKIIIIIGSISILLLCTLPDNAPDPHGRRPWGSGD